MEFNSERAATQACLNGPVTAVPATEEHRRPHRPLSPDHPVCRHCQKRNPNLSFRRRELFHISSVDVRERRAVIGRDGKRHEVVEAGKGEACCADIQSYARPEEDRLAAREPWRSQLHKLCSQKWQLVGAEFVFSVKRKVDCDWGTWDRCSSY